MSSPLARMTERTRAAPAWNGPLFGKPATTALSPRSSCLPQRSAGAGRPGTSSTATSRRGSKATTVASYRRPLPPICTEGRRTPATTCALVTTLPGATTAPLPSWPRSQLADPVIFTMLRATVRSTCGSSTPGSGGSTGRMSSRPTPANTRGNEVPATTPRNVLASPTIRSGITLSIALSTRESATARASTGDGPPRSAPPTNHITIETATTPATAPSTWSTAAPGCSNSRSRSRTPTIDPMNCPSQAITSTATSTIIERWTPACSPAARLGTTHIASSEPPTKPPSDSAPTTSPCR